MKTSNKKVLKSNQVWKLEVVEDAETGDPMIILPSSLLSKCGWKEGDDILWSEKGDGSWILSRVENKK